ncbi:DNA primase [Candidatus Saccharibacteria bacterium]|nr:DNA primase [Candidatus Saccharibacteria bacterium]
MQDAKEEIKARLPVEDVVSQYVELKRAGRTLKGRSPWGVDKTPSFMVSPEKGIWHDFSANKGGDIFTFVMEVEGITFKEAFEKLAQQAGVEVSKYAGGSAELSKRRARGREALELTTKYYQFCLSKSKKVCEYVFYKRNMNRGTVEEFRIGYSPANGKALKEFLTSRGFSVKEMEDAGLLNRFGGDMFRGRMMVPFIDTTGNVIGFTARVLDKSEPKYLNTQETLLFNKGRFVFGLAQAKEAIRKNGFVVIVEGNMDVISSHQAGVKEAVATSGTAMTENHLKMLSRLTNDIRLAYDGDEAGVKATERAIMLAGDLGINLTVISDYQGAKDPDELIQKGAELWQKAVQERRPAVEWLLDKYEEKVDMSSVFGKKEYSDIALKLLKYVTDEVERAQYEELVARRLGVTREDLRNKGRSLEEKLEKKGKRRLKEAKTVAGNGKLNQLEDNLLAIALFGGVEVPSEIEIPEDETRRAELEMVFENQYKGRAREELEAEMKELYRGLREEMAKAEIEKLQARLEEEGLGEEEEKEILRKITELQRG